jgi:murein DD-endopeptidase MepM/ murein hydrolase activator NlpD
MANEFYTLIVVPHAKARFRKYQVSVKLAKWVCGVTAAVVLGVTGIHGHYTKMAADVRELGRLRAENAQLRTTNQEYEQSQGKIQQKVLQLQNMVTKLGVMAGLEHSLPEAAAGVGGVTGLEASAPAIDSAKLAAMEQNLSTLSDRSSKLEEFYRDQTVLLSSTPSIWPVRGYLSAGFGNRIDPFTGQKDFHPGLDVSTPIGTKVFAPADGVVVSTSPQGAYGNAIVIDHGYGVVTRYGHLEGYAVKPAQKVKRGDLIGYVGSTGRSTGPHLHYEVWVRDQAQNPIHFILDEYRSFG